MAERPKPIVTRPIVTELALADALDQLVGLIEELRADASLRVEVATDETDLVKLVLRPAPPTQALPCVGRCRDIPGEVVRRVWNEGLRDYEIV